MYFINDLIHGKIEFHRRVVKSIIETPMFTRLQHIKQLGGLSYVYEEANHSRYDHCIGTYHCALKMIDHLEKNSNIKINDFYRDCISIAGLLHDVGHGPFSHMWEHISNIKHEENSDGCIDEIFKNITLFDDNIVHSNAIALIKALIRGEIKLLSNDMQNQIIKDQRNFIFEIINNNKTGIDVDKWDYLKRDKYYLNKRIDFKLNDDFDEVFTEAQVINDQIYYNSRNKIYNLYDTRSKFFIHFYHMPLNRVVEKIILKCSKLSDEKNLTEKRFKKKFSQISSNDIDSFLELTDINVIQFLETVCDNEITKYIYYLKNTNMIIPIKDSPDSNKDIWDTTVDIDHPGKEMAKIEKNLNIIDGVREVQQDYKGGSHKETYKHKLESINNNNNEE